MFIHLTVSMSSSNISTVNGVQCMGGLWARSTRASVVYLKKRNVDVLERDLMGNVSWLSVIV